jgi:DNA-binding transcriptional MerR regulator
VHSRLEDATKNVLLANRFRYLEFCSITQFMAMHNKNPTVSISQAARLSGLSVHMITYLGRTEILLPKVRGRGRMRLYTFSDVLFLKVIADLLARGIEVRRLRQALQRARTECELWIDIRKSPHRYLVTDGTELFIRHRGRLESKTKDGQLAFAFVLDLDPAHKAVSRVWPKQAQGVVPSRVRRSN